MAAARPLLPQPAAFGAATKAEAKQNEKNSGGNALRHAQQYSGHSRASGNPAGTLGIGCAVPPLEPALGPAKPDPCAGTSGNITLLNGTLRPGQKAEPDSTTAYTAVRLCRVKQVRFVA